MAIWFCRQQLLRCLFHPNRTATITLCRLHAIVYIMCVCVICLRVAGLCPWCDCDARCITPGLHYLFVVCALVFSKQCPYPITQETPNAVGGALTHAPTMHRQESMMCRASSFSDTTLEHTVAASVVSPDTSAWAMSSNGTIPDSIQPKRKQLPQDGLNRSGTLDRGMDALSATDLFVAPESMEAHAKRHKSMNESKDKDKLPVLTKAERAKYVNFWQAFKCKRPVQEMTAGMPSCKASMQIDSHKKHTVCTCFFVRTQPCKPLSDTASWRYLTTWHLFCWMISIVATN